MRDVIIACDFKNREDLIEFLIKNLVNNPDEVEVTELEKEKIQSVTKISFLSFLV